MTPDARVFLRALRAGDAETIFAYRSDPEVMRYQGCEPRTADEVRAFIASLSYEQPYAPGTWYQLGIAFRATDELIGDCGVHVPAGEPCQAEFGITLARAPRPRLGERSASSAAEPACNTRSIALVQRAGFRAEALHVKASGSRRVGRRRGVRDAAQRVDYGRPGVNVRPRSRD